MARDLEGYVSTLEIFNNIEFSDWAKIHKKTIFIVEI